MLGKSLDEKTQRDPAGSVISDNSLFDLFVILGSYSPHGEISKVSADTKIFVRDRREVPRWIDDRANHSEPYDSEPRADRIERSDREIAAGRSGGTRDGIKNSPEFITARRRGPIGTNGGESADCCCARAPV